MKKLIQKIKNLYIKNKKYLPSRKFVIVVGFVATIFIVVSLISYLAKLYKSKASDTSANTENQQIDPKNQTIQELLKNDTDKDGVYDWEEALWGTNKRKAATFNGTPDLAYIESKRAELKVEDTKDDKSLTETDKFAREFFSTYAAMKSSGSIDDDTIKQFSQELGDRVASADLVDKYGRKDIKTTGDDDIDSQETYYTAVSDIFSKYESKGMGDEVNIMNTGLEAYNKSGDSEYLKNLSTIAQAYEDFASSVVRVSVPNSLATYHLQIINAAHNTGLSIFSMAKAADDPIISVGGVSQYEKYSNELIKAVEDLEATFDE